LSGKKVDNEGTDTLSDDEDEGNTIMTTEELFKMRIEMANQLA
jgi:hypothetical protein